MCAFHIILHIISKLRGTCSTHPIAWFPFPLGFAAKRKNHFAFRSLEFALICFAKNAKFNCNFFTTIHRKRQNTASTPMVFVKFEIFAKIFFTDFFAKCERNFSHFFREMFCSLQTLLPSLTDLGFRVVV